MTKPVGPYTPIVRAGEWLISSGQLGLEAGALVGGGVTAETTQAIANVARLLAREGADLTAVVKTLCFLTDMEDFEAFNQAYIASFGDHRPARSTVGVAALALGATVEIEAWAYAPR